MKSYGITVLLAFTLILLQFNHSEAQTSTTDSNSTEQAAQADEFYRLGNAQFDNGTYTDAIFYYDKSLSIDPLNVNALYNKALALDRLGNTTDAVTAYQMVLGISPNDTDTLNNLGLALDKLGKYDQAILYYDRAIAAAPSDTYALYNKGLTLDHSGNHTGAMSYYDKVLAIDPTDVDALNKENLTFSNADKSQVNTIQKTDQTALIVVTIFVFIAIAIIAFNLITKSRRRSKIRMTQNETLATSEEKTISKNDDDDWKGI